MTKLPAEAYAIIEGRHSDPFHYLGLHKEGDKTVVRAFLPEASNVEAIGEHGEAAALLEDAGCGLTYSARDPASFAAALNRLLDQPAARSDMGRRALAQFEADFQANHIYPMLVRHLEALVTAEP